MLFNSVSSFTGMYFSGFIRSILFEIFQYLPSDSLPNVWIIIEQMSVVYLMWTPWLQLIFIVSRFYVFQNRFEACFGLIRHQFVLYNWFNSQQKPAFEEFLCFFFQLDLTMYWLPSPENDIRLVISVLFRCLLTVFQLWSCKCWQTAVLKRQIMISINYYVHCCYMFPSLPAKLAS